MLPALSFPRASQIFQPSFCSTGSTLTDAQAALKTLGRQALHAYLLTIEHPSEGKELAFRSELPGHLCRLRHSLGAQGTPA